MVDHQLRRIRFVTSRFVELQGLRLAVPALISAAAIGVAGAAGADAASVGLAAAVACLAAMFSDAYFKQYYERAFGRVDQEPASSTLVALGLAVALALSAVGTRHGLWLLAAMGFFHGWIGVRDSPFRLHQLLPAATALIGTAFLKRPVVDGLDTRSAHVLVTYFTAVAVAGFLDHRLPPAPGPRTHDGPPADPADPDNSPCLWL